MWVGTPPAQGWPLTRSLDQGGEGDHWAGGLHLHLPRRIRQGQGGCPSQLIITWHPKSIFFAWTFGCVLLVWQKVGYDLQIICEIGTYNAKQSVVVDPYVFGPLGSGTVIICTNRDPSKKFKKPWFLLFFFNWKTDLNEPLKSSRQKNR
jgi:hypothetical protein